MLYALLFIAAPALQAAAQVPPSQSSIPAFRLQAGTSVSMGLDGQGRLEIKRGESRALTPLDIDLVHKLLTEHPDASGPNGAIVRSNVQAPPIEANHIRFTFVSFDGGKHTVLVIEDGFDRSFLYRARIGRGERSQITDVCQTLPNKRGYEHWPNPIEWIEISDIHPVAWSGTLRCE